MNIVNEFFNNKSSTKDLATEFFEARSATMSYKPDYDNLLKPYCKNPDGILFSNGQDTLYFDTIKQAAEWLVDNDDGDVPNPYGTVKDSKWQSYPWAALPKPNQNSIMNNILNAACKKETRGDAREQLRHLAYGLIWDLEDPSEIEDPDIQLSYELGHGSQESIDQLKAKYAAQKEEKAKQLKQNKINYVNKHKDWAIYRLKKAVNTRTHKSLFDEYECEETYGYPKAGMNEYWGGDFMKYIKYLQVGINTNVTPGKKAKDLVKYFEYLEEVAKDVGLNVDENGFLAD